MTDWVIMPCFNEEQNIASTIDDVLKYNKNLVVIDDGSTDLTSSICQKKKIYFLRHVINLGKGAALKTGVEYALARGATKFVFIDSDGQHEAAEIPVFLLLLDKVQIVFGARKFNQSMPFVFRAGNFFLSRISSVLFGVNLHDTQCGYRAIRSEVYPAIAWKATDYSVEAEMIAKTGKNKLRYKEYAISTIYKNKYKGTTIVDGLRIGLKMVVFKFQR